MIWAFASIAETSFIMTKLTAITFYHSLKVVLTIHLTSKPHVTIAIKNVTHLCNNLAVGVSRGMERYGGARPGLAGWGLLRRGVAWSGAVGLGKVWLGCPHDSWEPAKQRAARNHLIL